MKLYGKFKVFNTEDTYVYAEYEYTRRSSKHYSDYWDIVGKDIITGTNIVCRFSVREEFFLQELMGNYFYPGNVYLYAHAPDTIEKDEVVSFLQSMSKEDIKEYSRKIKTAKKFHREAAKEAKRIVKSEIKTFKSQEKNYKVIKRKVQSIARRVI